MQVYYFYRHLSEQCIFVSHQPEEGHELEFIWIDSTRDDVINHVKDWQNKIHELSQLSLSEYHVKDILNVDHPCTFDSTEEYNLLILRKLVTPDDQIKNIDLGLEPQESAFGLATTPVSFIFNPDLLITVREKGNTILEVFIHRLQASLTCNIDDPGKPQKLATSPFDLALRLLCSIIDNYLDIRMPLTRRVEYWQRELLQGRKRFKQWHQLFQEMTLFQQIENLCEEQIEAMQEIRDEIVQNYHHLMGEDLVDPQDILLIRLDDLTGHIERVQKHTTRLRNSIQSAINLHFSAISNQTNENMRILAIITTVFAPLTLLTGIYGMNFEYMPGLSVENGFWLMLVAMLFCTVLLIYLFYRRHLLGRGERSILDLLAQQHHQRNVNLSWLLDEERYHSAQQQRKRARFKLRKSVD